MGKGLDGLGRDFLHTESQGHQVGYIFMSCSHLESKAGGLVPKL